MLIYRDATIFFVSGCVSVSSSQPTPPKPFHDEHIKVYSRMDGSLYPPHRDCGHWVIIHPPPKNKYI